MLLSWRTLFQGSQLVWCMSNWNFFIWGDEWRFMCAHFLLWLWHSFYSLFWTRLCCQCICSIYIHCLPCLSSCIILKCFKEMYYVQKDYNIMLYGVARFFFLLVLDPNRKFYIKCWNLIMSSSMNSVWCFWMKLLVHNFGFLIFLLLN